MVQSNVVRPSTPLNTNDRLPMRAIEIGTVFGGKRVQSLDAVKTTRSVPFRMTFSELQFVYVVVMSPVNELPGPAIGSIREFMVRDDDPPPEQAAVRVSLPSDSEIVQPVGSVGVPSPDGVPDAAAMAWTIVSSTAAAGAVGAEEDAGRLLGLMGEAHRTKQPAAMARPAIRRIRRFMDSLRSVKQGGVGEQGIGSGSHAGLPIGAGQARCLPVSVSMNRCR